jgi:outer membrane protein assembly factor BamB
LVVKAGGILSCLATSTGEPVWERKRIGNLGEYYASPVAADGKIYIAGRNGFVVVLADAAGFEVLARNDMGEEILATPSIADGRIYFRTRESLVCISNEAP